MTRFLRRQLCRFVFRRHRFGKPELVDSAIGTVMVFQCRRCLGYWSPR